MNTTFLRRGIVAVTLFAAVSLLMVGAAACSDSNSGGCNACPQVDAPITAAQCTAAGAAAECESAELVDVPGNAGLAACGPGVPYQACNWVNCKGPVHPCVSTVQ